ncbi:hypothetical protein [Entomohabitans teleogrylli]|uniref:hypothetical protein n=1 Tax=Entomohabitans teleogrylli TaxID=1384589 RepID=UPI000ACFC261|nr:hypothetical protein [Entomohabitans teleogrylli]
MRIPDALGADQAAAFPCPGLTAWQALEKIPTRPGETILISGAGGSVGHYLVQLAAQRGFVVHTLSHPRHAGRLETLGATRALAEPEDRQAPWPVADRYYAIVDAVSDERCDWLCRQLRANGHFVAIQGRAQHWPNPPFAQAFSLHEVALGALHSWGDDRDWQHLTHHGETLLTWLADGSLSGESLVETPFEQLNHSLTRLKARNFSGKMIALFN